MIAICSENIDFTTFGRYSSVIAAKSAIGISLLKVKKAHNRAQSGFFMRNAQLHPDMVGWAGDSSESPGSFLTGKANPVQFTTSQISLCGGELFTIKIEAAIMATIPARITSALQISGVNVTTTSIDIATIFQKRHDDVLKRIRTLECSTEFNARNFAAVEYTDAKGESRTQYKITRDGFAYLAMGFTGKRSAQFKEWFITAFNQLEQALRERQSPNIKYIPASRAEIEALARQLLAAERAKEEADRANAEYERMVFQAANNAERSHVYEFIAPRYMWPNDKQAAIIRIPGRTKEDATRGWAEMIYIGERRV
ncbi:MAG: Rha family transcriptional regulator [Plesiomonas sp.]